MHFTVSANIDLLKRLLDVIVDDILPLTEQAVCEGNKIFGAALLRKSDSSTYLAAANNEIESPLHHGEMHLLKLFHEIPESQRLPPKDLYFLSTHEPCSMCLSAITWAGFDNFFYFFSHIDSRDAFEIPHDLKILDEVFSVAPGEYKKHNAFWKSFNIVELLHDLTDPEVRQELLSFASVIELRYQEASAVYQADKAGNHIPLN